MLNTEGFDDLSEHNARAWKRISEFSLVGAHNSYCTTQTYYLQNGRVIDIEQRPCEDNFQILRRAMERNVVLLLTQFHFSWFQLI